jgi:hypothetical protein
MCLKEGHLCESHFMPQGILKLCTSNDSPPIIGTSEFMMPSARPITDYVLCSDCEQLLSRNGETWTIPQLATEQGDFPLHSKITTQEPEVTTEDAQGYLLATNPEIKAEQIIHFALGVFWKASIHSWRKGIKEPRIRLGPISDQLRLFLLEGKPLVHFVSLAVFVSPPPVEMIASCHPIQGGDTDGFLNFYFYVPGVMFNLRVGDISSVSRVGMISNRDAPVLVHNVNEAIVNLYKSGTGTAYRTKAMQEFLQRREAKGHSRHPFE